MKLALLGVAWINSGFIATVQKHTDPAPAPSPAPAPAPAPSLSSCAASTSVHSCYISCSSLASL